MKIKFLKKSKVRIIGPDKTTELTFPKDYSYTFLKADEESSSGQRRIHLNNAKPHYFYIDSDRISIS